MNRRAACLKFSDFHVYPPNTHDHRPGVLGVFLTQVLGECLTTCLCFSEGTQHELRRSLLMLVSPFWWVSTFPRMATSMAIYLLQMDIIFFSPLYLSTFCHLDPSAVHGKLSLYFRIQFCKLLSAWGFQRFTVLKAGQDPCFQSVLWSACLLIHLCSPIAHCWLISKVCSNHAGDVWCLAGWGDSHAALWGSSSWERFNHAQRNKRGDQLEAEW